VEELLGPVRLGQPGHADHGSTLARRRRGGSYLSRAWTRTDPGRSRGPSRSSVERVDVVGLRSPPCLRRAWPGHPSRACRRQLPRW
jgi:hypothetical protein